MAEITKPQYDLRNKVYKSNLVQPVAQQPLGASDYDTSEDKVWDAVTSGIGVFAELFEKSSLAADKIQARQLVMKKIEHSQELDQQLKMHLAKTDPSQIKLGDVIDKLKNGNLVIGENLDIKINPLALPSDIPDRVRELTELEYMRIDGALYSSLLEHTEKAQEAQDNFVLNKELLNLSNLLSEQLNKGLPEDENMNSPIFNKLLQSAFMALDDRESYGSFDPIEIKKGKQQIIQLFLERKYKSDLLKNKDKAIENAQKGFYKWTGNLNIQGVYPEKKGDVVTIGLAPKYYMNDALTKKSIEERENEENRKKGIEENKYKILREHNPNNEEYNEDVLRKELIKADVEPWQIEKMLFQNDAVVQRLEELDIAEEDKRKKVDAGILITEIALLNLRDREAFYNKYTNIENGQRISKSNEDLEKITGNKFLTEDYINKFIAGNIKYDQRKEEEDKRFEQSLLVQNEELDIKVNPNSDKYFIHRFGIFDKEGNLSLNKEAVDNDIRWKTLFPIPSERYKKVTELLFISQAQILSEEKTEEREQKKAKADNNDILNAKQQIIRNKINNIGTDVILNKEILPNKKLTIEQEIEIGSFDLKSQNVLDIVNKVTQDSVAVLQENLTYLKNEKKEPYLKDFIILAEKTVTDRLKELNEKPLDLAFIETKQDKKDDIDWEAIDLWYEQKGITRGSNLVPRYMIDDFTKKFNDSKNYQEVANLKNFIQSKFNEKGGEKAFYEVQQNLPDVLSAFLDIDLEYVNSKAEIFEAIKSNVAGNVANDPTSKNVNRLIMQALEKSFPAQFESQARRNNHVKLIERVYNAEKLKSVYEENSTTVNRVIKDLYGDYEVLENTMNTKLVFPKKLLAPYALNDKHMRQSIPWFVFKQQKAGKKIGIQGINEYKDNSLIEILRDILKPDGGGGNLDWTVVNDINQGTKVMLVHRVNHITKIIGTMTADDEPIKYSRDETIENFASKDVAEYADSFNDEWDKLSLWSFVEADFSREKFLDFYNNRNKYMKRPTFIGSNVLSGSLSREASDPGRREMELFFIPLGEKILEFEKRNNREIELEELEELYEKELSNRYTIEDRYLTTINKWATEYMQSFGSN